MASRIALFVLAILAGTLFAQGASEYCTSEKAAGESCYKQCCESFGYTYDGGCLVTPDQQDSVSSACGFCTDSYMQCTQSYEGGSSSGGSSYNDYSSSGGGCCSGFVALSLLGFMAIIKFKCD